MITMIVADNLTRVHVTYRLPGADSSIEVVAEDTRALVRTEQRE
jgi:hypothetical protein